MTISSDSCKSLNSPFVTMLIRVLNPNGDILEKAFEMTLDQFNVSMLFAFLLKNQESYILLLYP